MVHLVNFLFNIYFKNFFCRNIFKILCNSLKYSQSELSGIQMVCLLVLDCLTNQSLSQHGWLCMGTASGSLWEQTHFHYVSRLSKLHSEVWEAVCPCGSHLQREEGVRLGHAQRCAVEPAVLWSSEEGRLLPGASMKPEPVDRQKIIIASELLHLDVVTLARR